MLDASFPAGGGTVTAVQHIRAMRGKAQSHLMRCSDGGLYVVKFSNNPQHIRVLANEMFGTRLAKSLGLPVPDTAIVAVDSELIRNSPALGVNGKTPCAAGLQFGSRYVASLLDDRVFDLLPGIQLVGVRNLRTFAGALVFDKWTGNVDDRQATFWRAIKQKMYTASFIDQGDCFNVGEWTFPDEPMQGTYPSTLVYASVRGWESFDPWLGLVEGMTESKITYARRDIPAAWCGSEGDQNRLSSALMARRGRVRDLIEAFRRSSCHPFPKWHV